MSGRPGRVERSLYRNPIRQSVRRKSISGKVSRLRIRDICSDLESGGFLINFAMARLSTHWGDIPYLRAAISLIGLSGIEHLTLS
ncbi:hypothetical protein SAMN04487785_1205 [Dyella jiangningensis]|nr:hypothetical protein BDW41_108233 [Dyella sp. AtDHG13]SDL41290.1 hypothetical protein SAMN04487785_1205 [Dyella jiangningensis]